MYEINARKIEKRDVLTCLYNRWLFGTTAYIQYYGVDENCKN